jgi:hypothetical protein
MITGMARLDIFNRLLSRLCKIFLLSISTSKRLGKVIGNNLID